MKLNGFLLNEAQKAFDSGDYAKAIKPSEDAIEEINQLEKEPTTEYLLNKAKHFVNKALEHFKSKDYQSAIEQWKKAIPEYQRATDLAERRGETDFVESINASIETIKNNISKAEIQKDYNYVVGKVGQYNAEIANAKSSFENGDYESATTSFENSVVLLNEISTIAEKRNFNEISGLQKFELNQLLEDSRKGIAWSKIASAKLELEATSKLYESGAYLEARDTCLQIKERLKDVFDFVIKYDLLEEKGG